MAAKNTTHLWDQYVTEAQVEPFRLKVSAEETIEFECPSGVAAMRVAQGLRSGDLELILMNITGDHWNRIRELMGNAGHKAFPALIEDMLDHFGFYEDVKLVGPGGGTVTAHRPTEINALINQGYRPAGEAHAS